MSIPKPHYSPAREAHGLVFVSGQIPIDAERNLVGADIEAQTRRCLENMEAVLANHKLGLSDIVKTQVWLVRAEDFARFNQTYAEYFPDPAPARSTVVSALALPGALVEIDAIAARPGS